MTLDVALLTMKLHSYLIKSRHGIYYLRIQRNGVDRRVSLRTRDPQTAQLAAYSLGATIARMDTKKTKGWTLEFEGKKISTDGTDQDHKNALEALAVLVMARAGIEDKSQPAAVQSTPTLKIICLRDAITEYRPFLDKSKQADKSKKMAISTVNDLSAKLGADFDMSKLDDNVIETVWLAARLGEVAKTTAKRDLSFIRAFVAWASDKKRMYCPAPLTLSLDAKGGHRGYFKANDLKIIFETLPAKADKPYKFWLPIIGLYTGARIGEIAAIRTDGIYRKAGIDAFFLPGTKTDSSPRHIPIHPDLISLGLLEYVASRVKQGHEHLFDITWSAANGPGGEASKWFGRFIRDAGIADKTKVFHSFRPTIVDHLRQHGAPFEPRCQYLGHDAGGGVHNKTYGREPFGLQVLQSEVVDKIDWLKYMGWSPDLAALKAKADALINR